MEFATKYPEKLCKEAPSLASALAQTNYTGPVLAANGSWARTLEKGKEKVRGADFEFLCMDGNKPFQFAISWDGAWTVNKTDLTTELGEMTDELKELKKIEKKLLSEEKALAIALHKLQPLLPKAPHLRISMIAFTLSDDEFEVPSWTIEAKNWPLAGARENQKTAAVIINALRGKILKFVQG